MNDNDAAGNHFARAARHTLSRSGFAAPGVGEARVLVFESSAWVTQVDVAEHVLDAGERHRAARFRFDHDRRAYILAHVMWRMALGICLEVAPAEVPLASTASGQPRLPGTELATSLSHSGSWVAIVVCAAVTVGIDIERSPSRIIPDDLMATICTPDEAADIRELSAQEREYALLALWTRKEALLKAFGVGLAELPAKLPAARTGLVAPPAGISGMPPCRVRSLELPIELVGALAAPAAVELCRLHILDAAPDL